MYIPEEFKLNRFKQVSCPSARDMIGVTGEKKLDDSLYSGDEVRPVYNSKADAAADAIKHVKSKVNEQVSKSE